MIPLEKNKRILRVSAKAAEGQKDNCAICGKPLVYFAREKELECAVCRQTKPAGCACEDGHFVCDTCHSGGGAAIRRLLQESAEQDPVVLLNQMYRLPEVHLHGPEHHSIVPCVLLAAYRNCGGEIDLVKALEEAWKRGQKLPGGACGYLGVCGAAAGAGIFASLVSGATPLTPEAWAAPQRLTATCLEAIASIGGPRCCKRTSRIALEQAAAFSEREFGVRIPVSRPPCAHWPWNTECIRGRCPFWPGGKTGGEQEDFH